MTSITAPAQPECPTDEKTEPGLLSPMPLDPLPPDALYRRCDLSGLPFETTDQIEDITDVPGQERALAAVRFGIGIRRKGYNLFALGDPGTGKHTTIRQFLDQAAVNEPAPSDLCYVNNFELPHRPVALALPPGTGGNRPDTDFVAGSP